MYQVLIRKGKAIIEDIPVPIVSDHGVLVKVICSCISAGTEMMGVNESAKSIIKKALEQPEKVKKALKMVKSQGIDTVFDKVKEIDMGKPTGYSAAGVVISVGKNVLDLKVGDRVACAGAGHANHAEYIDVPRNLVTKIPNSLSFDLASTVTLGVIALQGVRRADLRLGEKVVVIGMGILGQLSMQILKASGCRVIGIDVDDRRLEVAKKSGCELILNSSRVDVINEVSNFTGGYGVDAAIITAASDSNTILSQAFNLCRKKGRVVLVGVVGNEYNRDIMYKKELDFLISTSYGPGRYDSNYEEKNVDYPYAYVRWTENRNMEGYLGLLNEGKVNIEPLIERIYDIKEADKAYEELKKPENKPLIILLKYDDKEKKIDRKVIVNKSFKTVDKINVAIVGAGGFAKGMHLPNLKKLNDKYSIYAIMSKTGTNAKEMAIKYNANYATTDYNEILNDKDINMVMICTRHNLHGKMTIDALKAGKAVFVEKPLSLNENEMNEIIEVVKELQIPYMVGFNRRFSKYAVEAKKHIKDRVNPMIINYQMNAGYIPLEHWIHTEEGGGRMIGECCHIFDLFNFFTESEVESISVNSITPKTDHISHRDNVITTIKYMDGSVCTLTYTSLGNTSYPKEFCQIYFDEKIITISDYKKIEGYGVKLNNLRTVNSEKGQYEELIEFYNVIKSGINYPIPLWQLEQATQISYAVNNEINK